MNHIYRSIWNDSTQTWVAVSEAARTTRGSGSQAGGGAAGFALRALAVASLLACGTLALANPTGGKVSAGNATINTSGATVTVNQSSQNAAINWQNFSIGSGESVVFVQPNANSVALNRVLGGDPSTLLGSLRANGQVFLINPNGLLFGQGASVNVQGLVASTLGLSDADFMAGKYGFAGTSTKPVANAGSITAADGGYVALLGARVSNTGTIAARLGTVALAGGQGVTLDIAGDSLLKVHVDQGALNALVENGGLIQADGGNVLMTTQAAGQLLNTVVNNTGVVQAQTVQSQGGVIKLLGDMNGGTVNAAGTLDASAPGGGNGGAIETSAAHVEVADGARITTLAAAGASGNWLIDPKDFTIATGKTGTVSGGTPSGDISPTTLQTALGTGNVTIQSSAGSTSAGTGNIYVDNDVTWASHTLTLTAANNVVVGTTASAASLTATATGGLVINTATANGGDAAVAGGTLVLATASSPTGGLGGTGFNGQVNLAATSSFSMNGHAYTIVDALGSGPTDTTSGTLQGMNAGLTGYYVLGANIDATATSGWSGKFTPIGKYTDSADHSGSTPVPPIIKQSDTFTGVFEGLGHKISNLTVSTTNATGTGLFGVVGGQAITSIGGAVPNGNAIGLVRDVQLTSPSVTGVGATGALVGLNAGIVDSAFVTGGVAATVNGNNNGTTSYAVFTGGLVGENIYTVQNSYANATTSSNNTTISVNSTPQVAGVVGGLVGLNAATLSNSYTGTAAVSGYEYVGGLAGENGGTIVNSHASNAVSVVGSDGLGFGGLVGYNTGSLSGTSVSGNSTTFSYADGSVTATNDVGGLVGLNAGSIALSQSSATVTGVAGSHNPTAVGGLVGANQGGAGGTGKQATLAVTGPPAAPARAGQAGSTGFAATITTSYSTGSVTATSGTDVGGLVGLNAAGAGGNGAAGCDNCLVGGAGGVGGVASISQAYSTSSVSGLNNVGGLVGRNVSAGAGTAGAASTGTTPGAGGAAGAGAAATIADTYSTGGVAIGSGGTNAGGLVGYDNAGAGPAASVATSFTTSALSGLGTVQGLAVGKDNGGSYTEVYYKTQGASAAFGSGSSANVAGLTASQITDSANASTNFNGFNFGSSSVGATWGAFGTNHPTLCALTVGCTINVYVEVLALIGSAPNQTTTSVAQSSTYGNTLPTFVDVLVNADGSLFTLPSGVSASWAGTANLAKNTATSATSQPAINTAAGSYNVLFDNVTANQVTFSGGDAAAQTLVGSYKLVDYGTGLGWTVNKAQIVVSAPTAPTKTYDGTLGVTLAANGALSAGTGNTITGTGIRAGDDVTLVQATSGNFASKNAASGITVNYSDSLTGAQAGNYQLVQSALTGDITPAPLVVSGTTVGAKTYDGTTTVSLGGSPVLRPGSGNNIATTTGVLGSDQSNLHLSAASSGNFNCAQVACATTVSVVDTLTGSAATNYVLTQPSLSATINPAPLTISGLSASNKTYDGTNAATIAGNATLTTSATNPTPGSGIVAGDTVTLTATSPTSGTFATVDAATHSQVVSFTDSLTGAQAGNYTLVMPTLTAFINPAPLTISGSTANDKTYDGTTAATLSNGVTAPGTGNTIGGTGVFGSDDVQLVQAGRFSSANAGASPQTVVVTDSLTGAKAMDYVIQAQPASVTATISPAPLTVSGQAVVTKTYDGTNAATLSGGTLAAGTGNTIAGNGVYSGDAGSVTLSAASSGTFGSVNASASAQAVAAADVLTLTGSAVGNYVLVQPALTGFINPAPLTVSGLSASGKVYDGTTTAQLAGTATLVAASGNTIAGNGILAADAGNVTLNASATGTFASANASASPQAVFTSDTLTLSGAATGNYVLVQPAALSATISPAQLVVSGSSVAGKTYNGSNVAAVSGGTLAAGGNNLIGTASGVYGSDDVQLVQGGTFASANASASPQAVTSTDHLSGAAAGNYVLAVPTGWTATISPAPLTVSGQTAATKTYDGSATAALSGGTLASAAGNTIGGNGVLAGDASGVALVAASTGTFASPNASPGAQAVGVADSLVLSGSAAGNYVLVQPAITGFINPAPLTATGTTVVTKTYDGTTAATIQGGTLAAAAGNTIGGNGVLASDAAGVAFTAATSGSFAGVNASTSAQGVTIVDGLVLSGSAAGNYVFVQPAPSGLITPAPLTVAGTTVGTRTYNGTNAATLSGGSIAAAAGNTIGGNGVLGSDAANLNLVLASSGTFASVNASATAQAVTVADALGGSAAGNYVLVQPTLTGFINPAPLTVNGTTVATRTYDGTTTAALSGGTLAPAAGNTLGGNGVLGSDASSVVLNLAATGTYASPDASANAHGVSVADSLALSGPAAGNYVLVQPTLSGLITQAPITVTGTTVVAKTYNGNNQANLAGGTFAPAAGNTIAGNGVAAADLANLVLSQAGTYASSNASASAQAVAVNDSLSGTAAGNYVLVEPTGLTGMITPAPLTVGNTVVTSRTYNGTNVANVTGGQLVAGAGNTIGGSGVLSADAANVHLTTVTSGTFASANASAGAQAVTVADTLTVTGAAAGNYVLVEPVLTGFINPAPLTVTGSTVADKTYDGTRGATLTGGTLAPVHTGNAATSDNIGTASGVLAGDAANVALVQGGTFASANANPNAQAVAANDSLVLSGSAAGNYVLVQPTGLSGLVSPAPITVSGATVVDKTYNGTNTASFTGGSLAAAAGNTIGGNGVVAADAANLRLTQAGTFASANANPNPQAVTASDVLSGSAASNYVLVQPTGLAGTISPAPVTVSGTTVATRTYDGTTTATLSGGTLSAAAGNTIGGNGVLSADAGFVSLQTAPSGTFASPNAGSAAQSVSVTDTLTLTGSAAGNYVLIQPTTLTGFINPAPLTVTGSSATSKAYDGTTLAAISGGTLAPVHNGSAATSDNIATASGVLASDAAGVQLVQSGNFASANVTGSSQAVAVHDSLVLTGSAAGNYVLVQPSSLSAAITPATLTITAAANTKTYDGTTSAAATPVVTGLVSGTTLSGLSESYTSANVAGANGSTLVVGGGIVVNDGNLGRNYTVVTASGTGTINPVTLTVADTLVGNKVYDGTTATTVSGGVLVGLFGNDDVTLAQSGHFASANAGTAVALVGSDSLSGAAAGNYVLQQPTGLTGVISPAPLTVSGTTVAGKVFDGSTRATLTGGTLVGVVASDVGSVTLNQGGQFVSLVPAANIAVVAADSLSGAAAGNYTLAQPTGLFGNIAPNPLMPTAAGLAMPLTNASYAWSTGTSPLLASADAGAGAGAAADAATGSPAGAAAGTATGTAGAAPGDAAESSKPEKRRVPALAGLNISVVEDGIRLPANGSKTSP